MGVGQGPRGLRRKPLKGENNWIRRIMGVKRIDEKNG